MAESAQGGNSAPRKEMSMEVRLLLAFLLMGAVMFLTPYIFKSTAPPASKAPPVAGVTGATGATGVTGASGQASPAPAAAAATAEPETLAKASAAPTGPPTSAPPQPLFVVNTDLYRIAFSNQGATVRSWQLKKFKGNDGKPLDLVNTAAGMQYPFSLYFPDQKPTANVNWAWYKPAIEPDGLGVTYEFSDGHTAVRKTFRFQKNSYLSQVTAEVSVDGKPVRSMIEWRGGFGDLTVSNPASSQRTLHFNVPENKLIETSYGSVKSGTPVAASGDFSFAGIADTYFGAVFLPQDGNTVHEVTFPDTARTPDEQKPQQFVGVAVSDGNINKFQLFVGPKDVNLLKRINPKLEQVVSFGWISVLAKPLFLIVNWFNNAFVHNYGWAIVIVTIAINFILFPLKLSNMKSMRKMQALKPQIDTINAKYKNLKMTDPRKAEQNQEVMELYKRHGVNPMGGCFPMLLQIPFFFAFYKVFTVSVEMRGASWLWVSDLSQPEHLAIRILPVVMIASQFLMQKMTPQATGDPNQQRMMMFMPLIFGFMFYNFPSGLVLYYLTSNLVGIAQQWFFNHTETAQEAARSVEPPKKKNGRK
jgi:YidC/Oxa1 family membrane protein insertase